MKDRVGCGCFGGVFGFWFCVMIGSWFGCGWLFFVLVCCNYYDYEIGLKKVSDDSRLRLMVLWLCLSRCCLEV